MRGRGNERRCVAVQATAKQLAVKTEHGFKATSDSNSVCGAVVSCIAKAWASTCHCMLPISGYDGVHNGIRRNHKRLDATCFGLMGSPCHGSYAIVVERSLNPQ
jgi:hypothetical protein